MSSNSEPWPSSPLLESSESPETDAVPEIAGGGDPAEPDKVEPAPDVQAEPAPSALPVAAQERVQSVDVLRGVALLGILAMNMVGFAWPGSVYSNPHALPDPNAWDTYFWVIQRLLFDTKMMTTFSMLFGAGLVLMSERAAARGARLIDVYYRRVTWLLVIGLIHAYLIWDGDILVDYALGGFLLYPFRKLRPAWLLVLGTLAILTIVPLFMGFLRVNDWMRQTAERGTAEIRAGRDIGIQDRVVRRAYLKMEKSREKKPNYVKNLEKELKTYRGGYGGIVADRAPTLFFGQLIGFPLGMGFVVVGRMLLGMGLMKLGFYSAALKRETYWKILIWCYGLGYPAVLFDMVHNVETGFFDPGYGLSGGFLLNYLGSVFVAIGHGALVMLICQAGAATWLTSRLAAAGRMALSNYLFDSILCTTLFYGYGLGWTGTMHRAELAGLVLAIWIFQLTLSPVWLRFFRYGPAEWMWRSLTYWKFQPILRAA